MSLLFSLDCTAYTCIHTYVYRNTAWWVHSLLLTCVRVHGWAFEIGEAVEGLVAGEKGFSLSQYPLIAFSAPAIGWGLVRSPPSMMARQRWWLFRSYLGSHIFEIPGGMLCHSRLPGPLALTVFPPHASAAFLGLCHRWISWGWAPMGSCSLHSHWNVGK